MKSMHHTQISDILSDCELEQRAPAEQEENSLSNIQAMAGAARESVLYYTHILRKAQRLINFKPPTWAFIGS